jgi:hypothetical protein
LAALLSGQSLRKGECPTFSRLWGRVQTSYARMCPRTIRAKPISPIPISDKVLGSGTAVAGIFDAYPVFGPQPPPEAVQKWIATPVNRLAMRPGAVRVKVNESALTTPFGAPLMFA